MGENLYSVLVCTEGSFAIALATLGIEKLECGLEGFYERGGELPGLEPKKYL